MNEKPNTKKNVLVLVGIFLVTALVISACVMPGPVQPTVDPIEQAMQTLQAQATQDFYSTVVSQLTATSEVPPGTTPDPTNINQIPGNTQVPTVAITQIVSTPVPTQIPTAAFTPTIIPPTPTPRPCYQVTFVSDVTIPDGSKIVAGTSFTKTWRLKNATKPVPYTTTCGHSRKPNARRWPNAGRRCRPNSARHGWTPIRRATTAGASAAIGAADLTARCRILRTGATTKRRKARASPLAAAHANI